MPRNSCFPAVWPHLPQEVHIDMAKKESHLPDVSFLTYVASMHSNQFACTRPLEVPFQKSSVSLFEYHDLFTMHKLSNL